MTHLSPFGSIFPGRLDQDFGVLWGFQVIHRPVINDYINSSFMLNIVNLIGVDQVANLCVGHPGSEPVFVDKDIILDFKKWVIGFLAKLKAYSRHLDLL